MQPYLILGLLGLLAWVPAIREPKYTRLSFLLCFCVLFFFMAFRANSVGTDTQSYLSLFARTGEADFPSGLEMISSAPVYNFYSKLLYDLVGYQHAIVIFNSAIICVGFGCFIYCMAENRFLASVLFVGSYSYFIAFNAMRQSVAVSLLLLGLILHVRHRRWAAFGLFLLSVGVHNTAIACLAALAIVALVSRKASLGPKGILAISLLGSASLSFAYPAVVDLFVHVFPRYQMYVDPSSGQVGYLTMNQGRQVYLYLPLLALMIVAAFDRETRNECVDSDKRHLIFLGSSIGFGFGVFCSSYELLARELYYFLPLICCFTADAVTKLDKTYQTMAFRLLVMSTVSAVGVYMLMSNYGNTVPYLLA